MAESEVIIGAAVEMTQQYLAGEMSVILAELQAAATEAGSVRDVAHLRHEAERGPLTLLPCVAARALEAGDRVCWDSLSRGDVDSFLHQTAVCAELWRFGVCAGLLEEE